MGDTDITMAVMGATGTGKSTFVNLVSGANFAVGEGLLSCTPAVQSTNPFDFCGRRVTMIDTPGFDDSTQSDTQILKLIVEYLAQKFRENKKLSGVIYMHRISDVRMSGISRRNLMMFQKLCGENTLRNVVIVTNMWDEVNKQKYEARERELATDKLLFKPVLDKGAAMMRHDNALASAQAILQRIVNNHPEPLQVQTEVVIQHKSLDQTTAGIELNKERNRQLEEAMRKHEEELRRQQEAMQAALRAQEIERARQAEEARRAMEARMAQQRAEQERERQRQEQARLEEERRRQEIQRALEAEAAARRAQEEEARRVQEDMARRAQEAQAEQARLQAHIEHLRQIERRRHRGGGGGDCLIC